MDITNKIAVVDVAKRALFLAYVACGKTTGAGILQERRNVTEDQVWANAVVGADYPGAEERASKVPKPLDRIYADYVFGRMMKLTLRWDNAKNSIEIPSSTPQRDYQAWCKVYPSYDSLIKAAISSLI